MSAWAAAAAAGAVGAVALASRRLAPTPVSGPMLLVAAGLASRSGRSRPARPGPGRPAVELLFEVALVAVLFTDASAVRWSELRRDDSLPLRLLGLGLPLTMVARERWAPGSCCRASACGNWRSSRSSWRPTDAALGQPAIADPRVPATVRRGLNVESGLNDGIALPFFVVLLAGATGDTAGTGAAEVFALALGLSTAVGLAVGFAGARLLAWSTRRGWVSDEWRQVPALGVAALGYCITVSLGGSGFITAWVAGLTFGVVWRSSAPPAMTATVGPTSVIGLAEQAGRRARVAELLRVRRRPARPGPLRDRLADGRLRGPEPDPRPHGARGPGTDRQPFPAADRPLRRLVRPPGPGVHRLRAAAARGRSARRRADRGRRRAHRGAERAPPRRDRRLGCHRLRRVARDRRRGRPRAPGRAGRKCRPRPPPAVRPHGRGPAAPPPGCVG